MRSQVLKLTRQTDSGLRSDHGQMHQELHVLSRTELAFFFFPSFRNVGYLDNLPIVPLGQDPVLFLQTGTIPNPARIGFADRF